MTQLAEISSFIKNKGQPFVFAILVAVISALIYYRYFNHNKNIQLPQQQKPSVASLPTKTSRFDTGNLIVENTEIKKLPIYTKVEKTFGENDKKTFLSFFGLKNDSQKIQDVNRGKGEVFRADNGFLIIYEKSMVYQTYVNADKTTGQFNEESLEQKAQETLQQLGLNLNTSSNSSYTKLEGEALIDTNNPSEANFINFLFNYQLNQLKVTSNSELVKISFSNNGSLFKVEMTLFDAGQPSENYPLVSIDQAIEVLKNGDYLTNISGNRDDLILLKSIASVDLNKAYLAYYFAYSDVFVQPVWVFEGTGQSSVGKFNVKYAVPAIQEKFFINKLQQP